MDELLIMIKKYMANLNNRKFINKLLIVLIITIILLIGINSLTSKKEDIGKDMVYEDGSYNDKESYMDYSTFLEGKLINILKKIKGVGEIDVMITLEDTSEKIPASNITKSSELTEETDSEGGIRKVVREEENRQTLQIGNSIVVLKEIQANIKGVIVVAEGAENLVVLESIYEAVKTGLGINGNKVQVFPSN